MDVHLVSLDVLMGWGNHMGTFGVDGVDHVIVFSKISHKDIFIEWLNIFMSL